MHVLFDVCGFASYQSRALNFFQDINTTTKREKQKNQLVKTFCQAQTILLFLVRASYENKKKTPLLIRLI